MLGVTAVDLYIPILTFVFGEAQMGGPCSIVSYHRLRQEFYGLPAAVTCFAQASAERVHPRTGTHARTHALRRLSLRDGHLRTPWSGSISSNGHSAPSAPEKPRRTSDGPR